MKNGEFIILDFKTGVERKKDIDQVKKYQQVVQQMFSKNVSGALLYTSSNDLKWVN